MSSPSFFKPLIDGIKIWLNDFHILSQFLHELLKGVAKSGWDRLVYVYDTYHYWDSFSDAKLRDWPLMGSPLSALLVLTLYLLIVRHGTSFVYSPLSKGHRGRHSTSSSSHLFDIGHFANKSFFSYLLVLYNLAMAALNGWIAFELIYCGIKRRYNFLCQLVYPEMDDHYETRIAEAIWWYFASKGFELMDTVFIILKRKSGQLTFLHIYHHSSMFAVWWVAAKFVPGGSALTAALVNCVVHVVMYGYYACSALGPKMRPYLWWKKYLTIIQLVQFTLGVSLGLNSIFTVCPFTRWMQYVFVAYAFSFLVLFGNFYYRTYLESRKSRKTEQHQSRPLHKSPNSLNLSSFFSSFNSHSASTPTLAGSGNGGSGSGSDSGSSQPAVKKSATTGGRQSKQSKVSMLNAKHNYGQMGRRKKVKSG